MRVFWVAHSPLLVVSYAVDDFDPVGVFDVEYHGIQQALEDGRGAEDTVL